MNRVARFQPSIRLSRNPRLALPRLSRRHPLPYHLRMTHADYQEIIQREKHRALVLALAVLTFLATVVILWSTA